MLRITLILAAACLGIFGIYQNANSEGQIPGWVKNIFNWFVEGQITEDDLVSALQFLIKERIIIEPATQNCSGSAACIPGFVTEIIDGDTIRVYGKSIRFALVDTPERGEAGFNAAKNFIANICPVGSSVIVDEDDKQTEGSYGRMIGVIYCNGINLNQAVLDAGHAEITTFYCTKSEFVNRSWAQKHGCEIKETQETSLPKTTQSPPAPTPQPEEIKCDPSYPTVCIPPYPPDLDCDEIPHINFKVLQPDPHRFDGDKDGIGCEKSTSTPPPSTPATETTQSSCDPSYPDVCIPPPPPDLDCGEISHRNFTVLPPDPHRFDGDKDGIGCES